MVVDKVVCERVWLTKMGGGGGSGGGGGIQNQKQEPHTKMWGKNISSGKMNMVRGEEYPLEIKNVL